MAARAPILVFMEFLLTSAQHIIASKLLARLENSVGKREIAHYKTCTADHKEGFDWERINRQKFTEF